ncbi:MAG: class I SAM-dependent rRNA methyltransferase [Bacteroidetes bacterium]|nr:class I SAM-dependent rRNA methyltransferase [Bacteroidota bacterium]
MSLPRVILHKGKEKKARNTYPFVFKDEIGGWEPRPQPGDWVEVLDFEGKLIGVGYANPKCSLAIRMMELNVSEPSPDLWERRIRQAIAKRKHLFSTTNACRLIHAEGDFLPGLIVDQIGDYAVLQSRSAGVEKVKKELACYLMDMLPLKGVYERSDMPSREDEGLKPWKGLLAGELPPARIEVHENGVKFWADLIGGHKTGYYADQRDNRKKLRDWMPEGAKVLDLFCYNGGFSMFAAQKASSVLGLDLDPEAIKFADENAKLNGYTNTTFLAADVFAWLEDAVTKPEKYDMIIIDPPAMAKKKEKADNEKWMFWRLIKGALQIASPGAKIVVSSCAYHLSQVQLFEAARFAAGDVIQTLSIHDITFQPEDHPWILQIPESLYLKTFFFQLESAQ